jgi:hypothetical protein
MTLEEYERALAEARANGGDAEICGKIEDLPPGPVARLALLAGHRPEPARELEAGL